MSFGSMAAFPVHKEPDPLGQGCPELSNDYFEQFVNYDPSDGGSPDYLPLDPALDNLTLPVNASTSNQLSGSSSQLNELLRLDDLQEPEFDLLDLTQNTAPSQVFTSPACNKVHTESTRRAARSDSDLLSLENISLQSPEIAPLSPSLPLRSKSPAPPLSSRKRYKFLDTISKTFSIPKARRPTTEPAVTAQQRSPIRKLTFGSSHRKVTLSSPTRRVTLGTPRKVTTGAEVHHLSPTRGPAKTIRKTKSSAKMMRPSQYTEQHIQEWSARLAAEAPKFDFGFSSPSGQLSPPHSARVSDSSNSSKQNAMMLAVESQKNSFSWDNPVPQYALHSGDLHTPLTTPTGGHQTFANSTDHHGNAMGYIPAGFSQAQQDSWVQVDPDYTTFVASSQYIQDPDAEPLWWAHATTAPLVQPQPAIYHQGQVEDTKSLAMQLQNELAYNSNELALSPSSLPQGLMIQMPHSPGHQQFLVDRTVQHHSHQQQHQPNSYFSPSLNAQNQRFMQSQAQMHNSPYHSQSPRMRKSCSGTDFSEPTSPRSMSISVPQHRSSRSSSFHVQKRRTGSQSRGGHSPRKASDYLIDQGRSMSTSTSRGQTPSHIHSSNHSKGSSMSKSSSGSKSGSGSSASGGGFADFVNFTPNDSGKILTGVAPSGSSKTKARREKEAMEKRRRLSQAAVRAVRAAGGSIDGLVEEGLFV